MKNHSSQKKGFTLIELLTVIAIIGLISSVVIVALSSARNKALNSKTLSQNAQYAKAAYIYYEDEGTYPWTTIGDNAFLCLGTGCIYRNNEVVNSIASLKKSVNIKRLAGALSSYISDSANTAVKEYQIGQYRYKGTVYTCVEGDVDLELCSQGRIFYPLAGGDCPQNASEAITTQDNSAILCTQTIESAIYSSADDLYEDEDEEGGGGGGGGGGGEGLSCQGEIVNCATLGLNSLEECEGTAPYSMFCSWTNSTPSSCSGSFQNDCSASNDDEAGCSAKAGCWFSPSEEYDGTGMCEGTGSGGCDDNWTDDEESDYICSEQVGCEFHEGSSASCENIATSCSYIHDAYNVCDAVPNCSMQ